MTKTIFDNCRLCPRLCGTDRRTAQGYCGCPSYLSAVRAGLHYYEEPFISGSNGSGTVFFTGCNLKCIYCQNKDISFSNESGYRITPERLSDIFLELRSKGANNINIVTGTPYTPLIAEALEISHSDLGIPVIWNSSAYESTETLKMLDGLVDIWLPDFKTLSTELAGKYFNAPDYPEVALKTIRWMAEHTGEEQFHPESLSSESVISDTDTVLDSEKMLMKKGICVRHLVIPGHTKDSENVLKCLSNQFGDKIWISLMSQYTPMRSDFCYPELNRKLTRREYEKIVDCAISLGLEKCLIQEGDVAEESFIPAFDGTGIIR